MPRRMGLRLQAQHRVYAAFFLYAFSMGGLYPRLAEIQRQMGVAEGELGLALIGVATGTLLSLTFLAPLLPRLGARATVLVLLPGIAVSFGAASHAGSPLAMYAMLVAAGLCMGCVETVVNLEADRVEHQIGRRIMNRAHAFWSFGFFGVGSFSAMASRLQWSPQWQLGLTVPLVLLATLLLLGRFEAAPARKAEACHDATAPRWAAPTPGILLLVACCVSALMLEGAGIDWSAIYMRDVFHTAASTGAMA
ncbi:MAG: MFS transporter, partial [Burkholderiales bacterium]|nr:MFS transporter [Burkholderiales bacterium]